MNVLDKGNPSVLEILGNVLISTAHGLPAMLLCTLVAKRLYLRCSVAGTLLFTLLSAAGVVLTIAASEGMLMLIYQRSTTLDWQIYAGVGIMGAIAGAIASLLLPRSSENKSLNK
ncbi:methionine ABC transporter permease [Neisseria sp. HMSC064E01]|jgi:putative D-methionine ABC transporter, permease protein|uniref:methionine ABC transporter permease n=1 Tax=Neisseria sp. HMSC064E01 TaxID=1715052 RepID=UPI001FEFD735|nr:methionine ABC transporter permease [Neisseria sp. HMSC064E01]